MTLARRTLRKQVSTQWFMDVDKKIEQPHSISHKRTLHHRLIDMTGPPHQPYYSRTVQTA